MTRFGRSTVGSDMFATHDAVREEAFIDDFASATARCTLATYDANFETYRAIEEALLRDAARGTGTGKGHVVSLTTTTPAPRIAARVVLALGANRDAVQRHCARLSTEYGFVHLSASVLTREFVKNETKGVPVFHRWDEVLRRNEWVFGTDLTLRLLRDAMQMHRGGGDVKFLIDWFPANLDQAKEFATKIAPVDFALFFDVEPSPETGISTGPDDPGDSERKLYEQFQEKHAAVLNMYKSNGMVHHLRSPSDQVHVTLQTNRSATNGPVPRGFWEKEKVPRDAWTRKDRSDWVFHDPSKGVVTVKLDYEHENTYAALQKTMRAERCEPADAFVLENGRFSFGAFGANDGANLDARDQETRARNAVTQLQLAASFKLGQAALEETIGRRVDRLIEAARH
jgi:UMP-CMP kinase|tara:strand:- start:561 stop:1757 length:1197 start_codon:yes stop_codon:yes gene_type:complete